MEALHHSTDGWLGGLWARTVLKSVVFAVFLGLVATSAFGVGADSSIFGGPATPAVSSAAGKQGPGTTADPALSAPLPLPSENPQPLPGFFSTFLRLILALGITLGLIYLTVWGLKVFWEKRGFTGPVEDGKPLKVLASTYLAPRKTIHLVEVGNRVLVVASGHEEVHPLDIVTDPAEVEALKKACHQGFPEVFGKFLNRQEAREHASQAQKIVSEGREAVSQYLDRVKSASKGLKKDSDEDEDKT